MIAMISQPMAGLTDDEIAQNRDNAARILMDRGYDVCNTFFSDAWLEDKQKQGMKNIPLAYLAKSLDSMSKCDAVYFCRGFRKARGCMIEYQTAKAYGLSVIIEDEEDVVDEG